MSTTAARGLPIAAHVGLLLAAALAAAFLVNLGLFALLPPKPPNLERGDRVLDVFVEGYQRAARGDAPALTDGARWRVQAERPELDRAPPFAMPLRLQLATRLGLTVDKVAVSFGTTRSEIVVLRMREEHRQHVREHLRREREAEIEAEWSREGPAPRPHMPPAPPPAPDPPIFAPPPPGVVLMSGYAIAAELPDGRWALMRQQNSSETLGWIGRLVLGGAATLLALLGIALLFARRLAAPIQRFAEAARRVGVDSVDEAVHEEGPRELQTAARAVNAMQARLRALVAQRTEMLAAVAHDLRTPLQRLRLVAEGADPALRDKLTKEAREIDALVSSFIAFARDDPTREARVKVDLAALVQSLCDDRAETGAPVSFEGPDRLVLLGQPVGVKRMVDNLVDNALKYGAAARVRVSTHDGFAMIDVEDDGPGIAPAEREKVFRPFVRGETAGMKAAGAGLGLAAAREIARAHGGDVEIVDGPSGCLRIRLPL